MTPGQPRMPVVGPQRQPSRSMAWSATVEPNTAMKSRNGSRVVNFRHKGKKELRFIGQPTNLIVVPTSGCRKHKRSIWSSFRLSKGKPTSERSPKLTGPLLTTPVRFTALGRGEGIWHRKQAGGKGRRSKHPGRVRSIFSGEKAAWSQRKASEWLKTRQIRIAKNASLSLDQSGLWSQSTGIQH